jgi:Flp pilus assembly pilin Flp
MIRLKIVRFLDNDSGAITVDWVVLTAAIVGIAVTVVGVISAGVLEAASDISFVLTDAIT